MNTFFGITQDEDEEEFEWVLTSFKALEKHQELDYELPGQSYSEILRRIIWKTIEEELTEKEQITIIKKLVEQQTFAEIGATFSRSPSTIKAIYYRGIHKLKPVLAKKLHSAKKNLLLDEKINDYL